MPVATPKKITAKTDGLLRTVRAIRADADGKLPTRIMILKCGNWPDSVKGRLTITPQDLAEFKQNFDAGVGLVDKSVGLPIDFSHNEWAEAGAWIKGLEIEGDAMYADPVEWSTAGAEAINGGMYKCISPSFYPAARGGWEDPEDLSSIVGNVLVGAGLTNIPFFKDLTPVKSSTETDDDSGDDKNVIYISASKKEGEKDMTLDELRVKDAGSLTDAEKQFLADHKAELSGEEQKKFGLVEAAIAPVAADDVSEEDRKLLADIKSGKTKIAKDGESAVDASRIASLEATAKKYEQEKAEQVIDAHISRGAIKADQRDRWTGRLLEASETDRAALEDDLKALPDNQLLASELGKEGDDSATGNAREQIAKLAAARVAEAKKEGKELDFITAQREVLAENPDLAKQERKENKI